MNDRNATELRVVASQTHEPIPVRGTLKRAKDEEPLDLPIQSWDYPILADCSVCEIPICKKDSMFGKWEHAE